MSRPHTDLLREFAQHHAECRFDNMEDMFSEAATLCESPIEVRFLAALCNSPEFLNGENYPRICTLQELLNYRGHLTSIVPQAHIRNYRVDFAVGRWFPEIGLIRFVAECDGHDFHERTKEQARRDKSRDRELMAHGWPVVRFTGSEIHADAMECVDSLCGAMWSIIESRSLLLAGGLK